MTSLGVSFVSQLDGGVLQPVLAWASATVSSVSSSGNGTQPQVTSLLLSWFLDRRLNNQIVSLVFALLWFVVSFASFVILLLVTRPSKGDDVDGANGDSPTKLSNVGWSRRILLTAKNLLSRVWWRNWASHLRSVLALLTSASVLLLLFSVALVAFWCVNAPAYNLFSTDSSVGNSTESAAGIVNSVINTAMQYLNDVILHTNSTALAIAYSEMPDLLDLIDRLATRLLDLLLIDFDAAALFQSLDEFMALVKMLLGSMNFIVNSRDTTVSALVTFTNTINTTRNDISQQVESVCSESGSPAALCSTIRNLLPSMQVNVNYKQLSIDSSVTIVTLLDKIFKFNITEIELQVMSLEAGLTGGLSGVQDQVNGLFDSLVVLISDAFDNVLNDLSGIRATLLGVTSSDVFKTIVTGVDTGVTVVFAVTVVSAIVGVAFVVIFASVWRFLWNTRRSRTLTRSQTDEVDFDDFSPPASATEDYQSSPSPHHLMGNSLEARECANPGLRQKVWRHNRKAKSSAVVLKTRPKVVACVVFGCVCSLLFIVGFAFLYAGSEIQMDVCRYVTEEPGIDKLDQMIDTFVDESAWEMIEQVLPVDLPITLTKSMMPKQIVKSVMQQCGNSTATIFQIFGLMNAFNMSELLQSDAINNVLNETRMSVHSLISEINVTTLIPSDVETILATLPDFAKIVDAEDYSTSIQELQKPLLKNLGSEQQLFDSLDELARQVLVKNATDTRGILIRYFSSSLRSKISEQTPILNNSLTVLLQKYQTLQNNRIVLNVSLTVISRLNLVKKTLARSEFLHRQVDSRFDQVVTEFTPEAANFLDDLAVKLMQSIGTCVGLLNTFNVISSACNTSLAAISWSGLTLMLASLLLTITIWSLIILLRIMRHQKAKLRGNR